MVDNLNFRKLTLQFGVEHYDYNMSCGNNNVWHNDNDHACLPSRVLKIEGVNLLFASFIRLWFFSNILFLFFNSFIQFEVNYSTIFVLGTRVNMTKKCMDDRLCVCFPVTPKSSKRCTHSSWLHSVCYKTLTCLLDKKSITSFIMKNKVPSCVVNVMLIVIHYNKVRHVILCNAAKTVHMEIGMSYSCTFQ